MRRRNVLITFVFMAVLAGCGNGHEPHAGEDGHGNHGHEEQAEGEKGASGKSGEHDHESASEESREGEKGSQELALSDEVIREFGLEVREAGPGSLSIRREFPGEVVFDEGLITHVTARVSGRAEKLLKQSGEQVSEGEVLAVLSSRELARVRSEFLSAKASLELARATFQRKQRLANDQIASQAELQESRQALSEAQVKVELVRRELRTLGMTPKGIKALDLESNESLARYELTAPVDGTIIERHLTRGERVSANAGGDSPFVIASRDRVWGQLSIFPQSIDDVSPGQSVTVKATDSDASATSSVTYVTPLMQESTRSARARVVLENASGQWYPGQFITGNVTVETVDADVVVPQTAIQTMDGGPRVFVRTDHGFRARPVKLGRKADGKVEILKGLSAGEPYAAVNTFTLKAEFGREQLKHAGHSH
ncbi:cobalt-zinc-cadmium efflux system membrane fusion protein [Halospina denitrificans]|uniref:Cobalt-zinc-cadmium efflux system membrane fusion protein n=1 Tax=Halospina denitrificans TaxID=332522 RepID=A0A4R7JXA7_9GAMM|nr:efflux RND transporter periplasmic adaptor subunit [Halospina denitrificans]TDT43091.1 cobalt-zinc-cadmium efflux system membrane fusion protein [Halospina denitrificans]